MASDHPATLLTTDSWLPIAQYTRMMPNTRELRHRYPLLLLVAASQGQRGQALGSMRTSTRRVF